MVKLLALDLDGTVVNEQLQVSQALVEMLQHLHREGGVKVVIATGRMFPSTIKFAQSLGLDSPMICYQGGMIREMTQHHDSHHNYPVLFHCPIDLDIAHEIAAMVHERELHTNLYVNDILHTTHFNPNSIYYQSITGVVPTHTPVAATALTAAPTKIMIIDDNCDLVLGEIRARHGERISVCKSRHNFCEVVNAKVSKWLALQQLMATWGLSAEDVMAVGDQENDLSMIRGAGLGVAMGNAPDHVKSEADFVTKSIDEDGVLHAIEELILKRGA